MYLIGLTGGIASGKSVIGRRLAEHGAAHIDADLLAREVVERGTPGLRAIAEEFGRSVIDADGRLDRAALGAIVFADSNKLALLNSITHPAVQALARERMAAATERDPDAVIVYDVPLLVEGGPVRDYDLVVVAHANENTRIDRLIELRGMSRVEAARRIGVQATDDERLAAADVVIDTNGTLEETLAQVDELWDSLPRT